MKSIKLKLITLFASACSLAIADTAIAEAITTTTTASTNMLTACQPAQVIQIANGLANTTLLPNDPGMTKTAVLLTFYSDNGSGKVQCWQSTIDYAKTYTFNAGGGCGCTTPAVQIDIQPTIRTGDKLSAYGIASVTKDFLGKSTIQISIGQGPVAPAFDARSGLVVTQGIIVPSLQMVLPK